MAFVDNVTLNIIAGKGGDGVVRWRRERAMAMGGPAGGNGGRGGNVYIVGERNLHTLHTFSNQKDFKAKDGEPGGSKKMHGGNGENLILKFPLGSILHIKEYDKTIELLTEGEEILLFRGGNGGLGNEHFKSSINRSPEEFTTGEIGEFGLVEVELQMIAEIGLIGYPNAGKSSLLNSLTNSKSKVASYAFTTLEPHLGDWHGHIIADIPGLIEGASEGKGLGHKFLRHIQRTNILVHLIDATSEDVVKDYKTIMGELVKFNSELVDKQEIVVLSKVDNVSDEKDLKEKQQALEEFTGKDVFLLSLYQDETVKGLEKILRESLK